MIPRVCVCVWGYECFIILHLTGLLHRFMHDISTLKPYFRNLANMYLNIMPMTVCHHICFFGFVNENKDICFQKTIFGNVRIETAISPIVFNFFRLIIYT